MREDHRVDFPDVFPKRLGSEIGARIDDERAPRRLDVNRRACSLIARIGRMTDLTVATDHRHALGRSGSEERQLQAVLAGFGVES